MWQTSFYYLLSAPKEPGLSKSAAPQGQAGEEIQLNLCSSNSEVPKGGASKGGVGNLGDVLNFLRN